MLYVNLATRAVISVQSHTRSPDEIFKVREEAHEETTNKAH